MQVSLSLLVAYIASTAAASPLSGSRVVAPALTFAQPTPLTNTLVLRGGGAVPEGAAITTASLFFGFYAIGFLIDPQMLTTMNFAGVPPLDTFHKWLCRILACGFLSYIAAINVADNKADMIKVVLAHSVGILLIAPLVAEVLNPAYFKPTLMHKFGYFGCFGVVALTLLAL